MSRSKRAHLIGWAVTIGAILLIAALDGLVGGGVTP